MALRSPRLSGFIGPHPQEALSFRLLDAHMAFFKIRKGGSDTVSAIASPAESVETLRKRARQRLIGATALVLAGVIGFPLVFDSQPRPIAVDIPIEIPDRAKAAKAGSAPSAIAAVGAVSGGDAVIVRPDALAVPVAGASAPAANSTNPINPASAAVAAALSASGRAPAFQPVAAAAVPAAAPAPAAPASLKAAAPAKAGSSPAASDSSTSAQTASAAAVGRFVVQVGAFADPAKASAARSKLEKAGLKTYTHVAETKEGKRIRVRLGPFDSRAEADKAAAKARGLDLAAAVLTL